MDGALGGVLSASFSSIHLTQLKGTVMAEKEKPTAENVSAAFRKFTGASSTKEERKRLSRALLKRKAKK